MAGLSAGELELGFPWGPVQQCGQEGLHAQEGDLDHRPPKVLVDRDGGLDLQAAAVLTALDHQIVERGSQMAEPGRHLDHALDVRRRQGGEAEGALGRGVPQLWRPKSPAFPEQMGHIPD